MKTLTILITALPGEAEAIAGELARFILDNTPACITRTAALTCWPPEPPLFSVRLAAHFPDNWKGELKRELT
jgi:hypothetical protein